MASGNTQIKYVKNGYVQFQGQKLKVWKKRWMVLYEGATADEAGILKYEKENDHIGGGPIRHRYPIKDIASVERIKPGERENGVRVLLTNQQFDHICFSFESESAANDWAEEILRLIGETKTEIPVELKEDSQQTAKLGNMKLTFGDANISLSVDSVKHSIPFTSIKEYKGESDNRRFWIKTRTDDYLVFQSLYSSSILSRLDRELPVRVSVCSGKIPFETWRRVFFARDGERGTWKSSMETIQTGNEYSVFPSLDQVDSQISSDEHDYCTIQDVPSLMEDSETS